MGRLPQPLGCGPDRGPSPRRHRQAHLKGPVGSLSGSVAPAISVVIAHSSAPVA